MDQCSQEPRFAQLEASMGTISETLQDVRDLLKASIRSEEQITALQKETADKEKRLRAVEFKLASGGWMERLIWIAIAAWVTGLLPRMLTGGSG